MNEELLFLLKQNTNWNTNLITSVKKLVDLIIITIKFHIMVMIFY